MPRTSRRRGRVRGRVCSDRAPVFAGGRVAALLRRLLLVAFFVEVGLLLIVLPWSTLWERNYFVYAWPVLEPLFTSPFFRGAVSGVGLLNLAAGVSQLTSGTRP